MSDILKFIKVDSPTWHTMWAALERQFGDLVGECNQTGEVWQYMGTVIRTPLNVIKAETMVEHQFRHRSLNGKREYFSVHTPYGRCKDDFIEPEKKA